MARVQETRFASRRGLSDFRVRGARARRHRTGRDRCDVLASREATHQPSGSGRRSWGLDCQGRQMLDGRHHQDVMVGCELAGYSRYDARSGRALARASGGCLTLWHGSAVRH